MSKYRSETVDRLAEAFGALANPHRLRILERLAACCPKGPRPRTTEAATRCVGELGKDLGIAASTVSHHIKELRRAGLIHIERSGRNVRCRVDREALQAIADFLALAETRATRPDVEEDSR